VARPLREQFAIAAFVTLVPVGVIMSYASVTSYYSQLAQVRNDAETYATMIARHLEGSAVDRESIMGYLNVLPLPDGSQVIVADSKGRTIASKDYKPESRGGQLIPVPITLAGGDLTVSVGVPTGIAWQRSGPDTRRIIAISGAATLILLVVLGVFLRRLLPALSSLERSAERVGAGDLSVPFTEHMPARELEHLRDAFHDMVSKLRVAREAIARQIEEERQMRLELESLQQQVIRQERLAAIGVLVSGIAHELNNPLQAISGFSELLQNDPQISEQSKRDLDLIHQESTRAGAIIRNLSRFGRQQGSTPVAVQLNEVVSSVIELRQRRLIEQNIRLDRDEQATKPARAVFTELQQVALNFLINAEQSVRGCDPAQRRIILRTRDDADRVRLEVEDSGAGVSAENEAKLFQPFFTTKPVGEGTGLGLSVSYGIIRSLGGTIGYRRGTLGALFFFTVPIFGADAGVTEAAADRAETG
jgi:C4-dicarboxylate-specific signal transduction histidine kinase